MNKQQYVARKTLQSCQSWLSRQQLKTLNGLIKAGDVAGAMNGLHTIMNRRRMRGGG